jgi:lysyl-tRNA synthetase class 2
MAAGGRASPLEISTLRRRAALVASVREFFAARGVLEVETPALSRAGVSDLALESVIAAVRSLGGTHYLHTSPEYAMKRLIAAGSGDIYQICRVFRDDELGRWHQPEFTMLEWYRVGWDELALMDEVAELLLALFGRGDWTVRRRTYTECLRDCVGAEPTDDSATLAARLAALGIDVPRGLDHDALLDLAFGAVVAPRLGARTLTLVHDYPASQAALARLKGDPPVAARFEAFAGGLELANGFCELTDAVEQRRRFEAQLAIRRAAGRPVPPLDEDLLAALERGLPPCAGVAVGLDRVIAVALRVEGLDEVLPFPHRRD